MKTYRSRITNLIICIGLVLSSCSNNEPKVISNEFLSLSLWSDWKYKTLQGIDTIEGLFTDGCDEISFSAGFSSGEYTHKADDLYYEELTVDGVLCKIVEIQEQSDVLLFLIFKKGPDLFDNGQMSITNPGDVQKFISIFRSVRFL